MTVGRIAEDHAGKGDISGIAGFLFARFDLGDLFRLLALDVGGAQTRVLQYLREQVQRVALIFLERRKGGD